MSSVPPEAIAGLLALGERFLSVLENAVNREADVRLAEVNKFEGGDYVALDANRQTAAVEVARIAAATAESAKLFLAAGAADAERVRARHQEEDHARAAREERASRSSREREAFRRSSNGRFQ